MTEFKDKTGVVILGGGPAGLSAALWCAELGLKAILLEKDREFGGQLLNIFNPITNYIGVETPNGKVMRDRFLDSLKSIKTITRVNADAAEIDPAEKIVTLKSGERYSAGGIIIATGVRRRRLGVAGEEAFQGKGIIDSGVKQQEKVKNKIVVIVGGGDAAVENALILSENAAKVYLVHRGPMPRARSEFIDRVGEQPKIELRLNTVVRAMIGDEKLNAVESENLITGAIEQLKTDIALIRIGVEPNTELFRGKIGLDERGYILTDSRCQTNVAGVYAVGDAANPGSPTISTAAGTGAAAAKVAHSLLFQCSLL